MTEVFSLQPNDQREHLRKEANEVFRPSRPTTISTALRGRSEQLRRTHETLETPGRSVFVYGERGVGKTSLALTGAYQFNHSSYDPVVIACHPSLSFGELVTQVFRNLRALDPKSGEKLRIKEVAAKSPVGHVIFRTDEKPNEYLTRVDPNLAVDLFMTAAPFAREKPTVVFIDELDTVTSSDMKRDLAYLVKQLGDRDCPIKFIFAGIADTVDDLVEGHASASRYMATIHLERLSLDQLKELICSGFEHLEMKIRDEFAWRIARISDGFAHFSHLVGLKLALQVIEADDGSRVTSEIFGRAIVGAVEDSDAWLRREYELAVQKYHDDYEQILWGAADHWELARSTDQIFQSYQRICRDLGREPMDKTDGFYRKLAALRKNTHGEVLVCPRRSWYQFRHTILRGYCRLVADSREVVVGKDYGVAQGWTPPRSEDDGGR